MYRVKELTDVLGITIKKDEANKVVTFLCQLSAYTENAQFNVSTKMLRTVDDVRTKIQISTGPIFIPELAA